MFNNLKEKITKVYRKTENKTQKQWTKILCSQGKTVNILE